MPRKRREVPWLDQRDGVYYVNWYDRAARLSKRLSLGTTDLIQAQIRLGEYLSKGHTIFRDAGPVGLTVTDALDDYFREHVALYVVDKVRQGNAIKHLKRWFGTTLVTDVDIPSSRKYTDARRIGAIGGGAKHKDASGSDSTIRRELNVLQAAANHAARWRRIGPSAIPPTAMPSIELPPETGRHHLDNNDWLTKAELARALATAPEYVRDFIVIAYDTASRRKAVERLTRFQVDLRASRVNLRGRDETDNQRRSAKRRPIVPIGPTARPVYEKLMARAEADKVEWLFGSPREMYWPFRHHMESIGLGHKRNPHILRHTRATHLLQDGVPIYNVARLLGDTIATVEKVYGHQSPEYLAESLQQERGA